MRIALAILMAFHAVGHLPGFLSSWRLATLDELPYRTTVLAGRVDLGDAGIHTVGALWLLSALGFLAVSAGALADRPWWIPAALALATLSLCLTVLGLPETRIGIAVNGVFVAALLLAPRLGWL